jgi:hypothetical protein
MLTQTQIGALAQELRNDPAGKGYAAHLPESPGTVLQMMTALTESAVQVIRSTTAQAWAATGPYAKIVDAAADPAHPVRASCLLIRETLASGVDIHMGRADVAAMVTAWVNAGVITAAQRDDLFGRATQPASRAFILGLDGLTIEDIISAQEV